MFPHLISLLRLSFSKYCTSFLCCCALLSLFLSFSPPVIVWYTHPPPLCDCTGSLQWHVYTNYLNRPLFCQPCCAAQLLISPLSVQHAALYYFSCACAVFFPNTGLKIGHRGSVPPAFCSQYVCVCG